VFWKSLRDQKWQIVGFGLALLSIAVMDVMIWPSYRDQLQNFDIPPALQAFFGTDANIATAAGFLGLEYYSWIPILLLVYAVIAGTGAIAGEESSGTMDLLLAQPASRRSVVTQKAAASVIGSVLIIAIGQIGFAAAIPLVSIDVSVADTALASANMLPVTLLFYAVALWAGAVAPSRALASAFVIGMAIGAYFVNAIATGVSTLQNLRYASPFYYCGSADVLTHGLVWWHIGLLSGIGAAFFALTLRSFERRDVSIGGASDLDVYGVLRRVLARDAGV
jgi:ABC-2 type transport system permease protein